MLLRIVDPQFQVVCTATKVKSVPLVIVQVEPSIENLMTKRNSYLKTDCIHRMKRCKHVI